jgi:hypothetical protein
MNKERWEFVIGFVVLLFALIIIMYVWDYLEFKGILGITLLIVYGIGFIRGGIFNE